MVRVVSLAVGAVVLLSCARGPAKLALFQRGEKLYRDGRYADAQIQFRKALQEDPRFGEAWLSLGRTEERLGNYASALAALRQAVAAMPGQDSPEAALGNFLLVAYLGNPSHPTDLYDQISAISDRLLRRNQSSFEGMRLRAFLASTGADLTATLRYFENANRLKPDQPDVITAFCQSLISNGEENRAEQEARNFLKKQPSYGPLYTMLYQYYRQAGRSADAESILQSKVAHNPAEPLYRIELARHYAVAGKAAESSKVLNEMLADRKKFPHGHLSAGDFFMERKDWRAAREQYELGVETDSRSRVMYWKRLVQVDVISNDLQSAQDTLDRILKAVPNDSDALAARADLHVASRDPGQRKLAISEFAALVQRFPDRVDYRYRYAETLRIDGQNEAARSQYILIAQRQPNSLEALRMIADLSIKGKHIDEALAYSDRVLALSPRDPLALLVRSAALAAKGRLSETRSVLTTLVREHPEIREAQLQLGLLLIEEKHYTEAETQFRRGYLPGTGDVQSLKGLLEVYRAQNRLDRAVSLLRQEATKTPQSTQVRELLAKTAAQAGDHETAVAEFEHLAEAEPQSAEIAVDLALAYQAKGDLVRAAARLEKALEMAPANPLIYAYLGKVQEDQGKKSEAMASYRKSLSIDGRNPWVMNNLAWLLADTGGRLTEAMTLAQNAARTDPANTSFSDTIGWIYFKEKDLSSAIHVFQGLREKKPADANLRIHLSEALLASGEQNRARSELLSALELPLTPDEKSAINKLLGNIPQAR